MSLVASQLDPVCRVVVRDKPDGGRVAVQNQRRQPGRVFTVGKSPHLDRIASAKPFDDQAAERVGREIQQFEGIHDHPGIGSGASWRPN